MSKQNNLLVTLANQSFVEQAKQLFSSVYHNAGWKGDYMLLADDISENDLEWFKKKEIIIYNCNPLWGSSIGKGYNPVVLNKFYLFTSYFKKWNRIIYIDADVIVKGPLNKLTKLNGFAAVKSTVNLGDQFIHDNQQYKLIENKYKTVAKSFNTGFFVFPASLIKDDTIDSLLKLFENYKDISLYADEAILNLYFYKNWKSLPYIYNYLITIDLLNNNYKPAYSNALLYHFIKIDGIEKCRPWHPENIFYEEWNYNLQRAEEINISKPIKVAEWSISNVLLNSFILKFSFLFNFIFNIYDGIKTLCKKSDELMHRVAGNIGLLIKKRNEKLYYKLKKIKEK